AYSLLQRSMQERGLSLKEAINQAVRKALTPANATSSFRTRTFPMGNPVVPLEKSLQLAGQLEDEEIIRKLAMGK
ncbi:MAG: antitoxin, partial [Candidatus Dormibacteraceae bacterium]